jgi:hypothetical protein
MEVEIFLLYEIFPRDHQWRDDTGPTRPSLGGVQCAQDGSAKARIERQKHLRRERLDLLSPFTVLRGQ